MGEQRFPGSAVPAVPLELLVLALAWQVCGVHSGLTQDFLRIVT